MTNKLVAWFGISRQQASTDIKRYLTVHNLDSLIHDTRVKAYVPAPGFRPVLTNGYINEYLDLISGLACERQGLTLNSDSYVSAVQLPDRSVRPEVLREFLRACRSRSSLKIRYASMSKAAYQEHIVTPHTLVSTGYRWHARAYCHLQGEFRDFILSRIDRTPQPVTSAAHTLTPAVTQDEDWNTTLLLSLVPNSHLSEWQKSLVERDFGMGDGRLQISVRKALALYTLQRFQVAITEEESADATRFPLQLIEGDRAKVSSYRQGALLNG